MNEKGLSYIEVLICMVILLAIMAPVFSGFLQARQVLNYAVHNYEANLLLSNLLIDIENAIKQNNEFNEMFLSPEQTNEICDLELVLNALGLKEEYKLNKYNYSINIQNITNSIQKDVVRFSTAFELGENSAQFETNNIYLFNDFDYLNFYDFIISIDDHFNVRKGDVTIADQSDLIADLSILNNDLAFMKLDIEKISNIKNIHIKGENKTILMDVKLNDQTYKDLIHINFDEASNQMLISYYVEDACLSCYLITIGIYDQSFNNINVITKVVS